MTMVQENWASLIKPKAIEIEKGSLTPTYGRFIARPLDAWMAIRLETDFAEFC
jgi:hypothetical protein